MRSPPPAVICLCLVSLPWPGRPACAGSTAPIEIGLEERSRVIETWFPVTLTPTRGATYGACGETETDPDRFLSVRIGDVTPERIVRIDRVRVRTRHAILVDTSFSMVENGNLVSAAQFLDRYVAAMSDKEQVALFAFSDTKWMLTGFTDDRSRLAAANRSLHAGSGTRLWDSLGEIFRELAVQTEPQKMLTIVTDGLDYEGSRWSALLAQLASHPEIPVFIVGLRTSVGQYRPSGLHHSLGRDANRAADPLVELSARRENVFFFSLSTDPTPAEMDAAIYQIGSWRDRRAIVRALLPSPAEGGNGLESGETRVDTLGEYFATCRVRVPRPRPEPAAVDAHPLPAVPDGSRERVPTPRGWTRELWTRAFTKEDRARQVEARSISLSYPAACEGLLSTDGLALAPDGLEGELVQIAEVARAPTGRPCVAGCILDTALQRGPRYVPAESHRDVFRFDKGRITPSRQFRPFHIEAPPPRGDGRPFDASRVLDRVRAWPRIADEGFGAELPKADGYAEHTLHPLLLEGEALLEQWEFLTRSVLRLPGVRAHFLRLHRLEFEREIAAIFNAYRRAAGLEEISAARVLEELRRPEFQGIEEIASLARRRDHPTLLDAKRSIAAWLADLPASEVFRRWEEAAVGRYLSLSDRSSAEEFVRSFVTDWAAVRPHFALPLRTHVLLPAALLEDPRSGALGFVRVLLPRADWMYMRLRMELDGHVSGIGPCAARRSLSLPYDLIPERPMALEALHGELTAEPDAPPPLAGRDVQRAELTYEPNPDIDEPCRRWFSRASFPEHPYPVARIIVALHGTDGRLTWTAVVRRQEGRPAEVVDAAWISGGTDDDGDASRLGLSWEDPEHPERHGPETPPR